MIVEIPHNYPAEDIPFLRVKSLTPEYITNTHVDQYETEIRKLARENIGGPCLFDVAEYLREKICEINDGVLDQYNGIMQKKEEAERELMGGMTFTQSEQLSYTPVNKETFSKWCTEFLAELKAR